MSWCHKCQRYHRFGVWVGSRRRWARVPGSDRLLEFKKVESAVTAAGVFQAEYPQDRFVAGALGVVAVDGSARWSEAQIEKRKAYWRGQKAPSPQPSPTGGEGDASGQKTTETEQEVAT